MEMYKCGLQRYTYTLSPFVVRCLFVYAAAVKNQTCTLDLTPPECNI